MIIPRQVGTHYVQPGYVTTAERKNQRSHADNDLSNAHYQILVMRLLVDGQGKLQQGVVIDLNEQPVGYFRQLDALPALVASWLSAQEHGSLDCNNPPDD